ncbi:MAG: hypothetical protein AAGG68_25195 [Bacteroidota bacterium]
MKFKFTVQFLSLSLTCLFIFSCGDLDENLGGAVEEFRLFREESVAAIDEAIISVENGLMSGTDALKALGRQLDQSIQDVLVYNVPFILDKLTGEATSASFCAADFAASRSLHYMRTMKAELLTGELPEPPPPTICQSSINNIDLNAPEEIRSILTIYGYDFIKKDSFEVFFASDEGKTTPLKGSIRFQTDYEFTINLSTYPEEFVEDWDYLSIQFSGQEIFAISIVRKRSEEQLTETKYISIPKFGFLPPHTNGDLEFDGDGPNVLVNARLRYNRKQAYIVLYMLAEETNPDWTRAEGWSNPLYYYTAPEGWHIKGIEGVVNFENLVNYTDTDSEIDIFFTSIGQAEVTGDAQGDDAGLQTQVNFNFTYQVPVIIEQD